MARDTAQAAQQIAASAHEQRVAVDQIAVAMREIDQATSQFVSGASGSRSAAENLGDLETLVRRVLGEDAAAFLTDARR